MMKPVSSHTFFNEHELGTRFRHKTSQRTYRLCRYTNTKLEGTLFLYCSDNDDRIEITNDKDWELAEPTPEDPQALLTRLLECFHDGDRKELLSALDDISKHIRQMHKLPVIRKDTTYSTAVYVIPDGKEINSDTTTTNSTTEGTTEAI